MRFLLAVVYFLLMIGVCDGQPGWLKYVKTVSPSASYKPLRVKEDMPTMQSSMLKEGLVLRVDPTELKTLYDKKPHDFRFQLPFLDSSLLDSLSIILTRVPLISSDFHVRTSDGQYHVIDTGLHYRGISSDGQIKACFSFFSDGMMGFLFSEKGTYCIGAIGDEGLEPLERDYVMYNTKDLLYSMPLRCHNTDELDVIIDKLNKGITTTHTTDCIPISVAFEGDYDLFLKNNSNVNKAMAYVIGLFNAVSYMYSLEMISLELSSVYLWTTEDPYATYNSSIDVLNEFTERICNKTALVSQDSEWDLAHFLTTRTKYMGGLAYLDVLCAQDQTCLDTRKKKVGMSNIDPVTNSTLPPIPVYEWNLKVLTHELGHNLGSHHTHWCGWSNGPIDFCYPVEGDCEQLSATPNYIGTVMSYCHLDYFDTNTSIDLNLGFGEEPGNYIRNQVANAHCLDLPPNAPKLCEFTPICGNATEAIYSVINNGYLYNWSGIPTEWIVGNWSPTVSIDWTKASAGIYTIQVTANNGVCDGQPLFFDVEVFPSNAPEVITSTSMLCEGEELTIEAKEAIADFFHWDCDQCSTEPLPLTSGPHILNWGSEVGNKEIQLWTEKKSTTIIPSLTYSNTTNMPVGPDACSQIISPIIIKEGPSIIPEGLTVTVNLLHYTAQVGLYLRSPEGNIIRLAWNNGGEEAFRNITFSDNAPLSIINAQVPWSGNYQPEGSISDFCNVKSNFSKLSDFAGETAKGTWELIVQDVMDNGEGLLLDWSLNFPEEAIFQHCVSDTTALAISISDCIHGEVIPISCQDIIYAQDFDSSITNGAQPWDNGITFPGWYASDGHNKTAFTEWFIDAEEGSSVGLYGFGSNEDKSLGTISNGTSGHYFGVRFKNESSRKITGLKIRYKGEQWRIGESEKEDTLKMSYFIGEAKQVHSDEWVRVPEGDFISLIQAGIAKSIDGNVFSSIQEYTLPMIVADDSEFWIRWQDSPFSDHGLSIDDVKIEAVFEALPAPDVEIKTTLCTGDSVFIFVSNEEEVIVSSNDGVYEAVSSEGFFVDPLPKEGRVYEVYYMSDGCTSLSYFSAPVEVIASPSAPIVEMVSGVCAGDHLIISCESEYEGVDYTVMRNDAEFIGEGHGPFSDLDPVQGSFYTIVYATEEGCVSLPYTTDEINIYKIPDLVLTNNGPLCDGGTLRLFCNLEGMKEYKWQGPNNYTSQEKDPIFPSINSDVEGIYYLDVVTNEGCHATDSTHVLLTPALSIIGDTLLCAGDDLVLSVNSELESAVYEWKGPGLSDYKLPQLQLTSVTEAASGLYSVVVSSSEDCIVELLTEVTVRPSPKVKLESNSPVCEGSLLKLSVLASEEYEYEYEWMNEDGLIDQESTISIKEAKETKYYLTTTSLNGCSTLDSIFIDIFPLPLAKIAGGSVFCEGDTVKLGSVNDNEHYLYEWTGPNGFLSSEKEVDLGEAKTFLGGPYHLSIIDETNGCFDSTSLLLEVFPVPSVEVGNDVTVCEGSEVSLSAIFSDEGVHHWIGPNEFTSNKMNTVLPYCTLEMAGEYVLQVTDPNGCVAIDMMIVEILPTPEAIIESNSPVCHGEKLILSANPAEAVLNSWKGPLGFQSYEKSLMFDDVNVFNEGVYIFRTKGENGCVASDTLEVVVHPLPILNVFSNSPVCEGDTLFFESLADHPFYEWKGPQAFQSNQQNPFLPDISLGQAGDYIVEVMDDHGCKNKAMLSVSVMVSPEANIALSAITICEGDSLRLTASSNDGLVLYEWIGPNGQYWEGQELFFLHSDTSMSGNYELTATLFPGCVGKATAEVNIIPKPEAVLSSNSPVCAGSTLFISVDQEADFSYLWQKPDGGSSDLSELIITDATNNVTGFYHLTITDEHLCTITDSVFVEVIVPESPILLSNAPVCVGDSLFLKALGASDLSYSWAGPNGFNSIEKFPMIEKASLDQMGIYYLKATDPNGCESIDSLKVVVNSIDKVDILPLLHFCVDDNQDYPLNKLMKPTVEGGVFFLDEVEVNSINPSLLSGGKHLIEYRVTNGVCEEMAMGMIVIDTLLKPKLMDNFLFCGTDETIYSFSNQFKPSISGGVFFLDGEVKTTFCPSVLSHGKHKLRYEVVNEGCGKGEVSGWLEVITPPEPLITASKLSCCLSDTTDVIDLKVRSVKKGIYYQWYVDNKPFSQSIKAKYDGDTNVFFRGVRPDAPFTFYRLEERNGPCNSFSNDLTIRGVGIPEAPELLGASVISYCKNIGGPLQLMLYPHDLYPVIYKWSSLPDSSVVHSEENSIFLDLSKTPEGEYFINVAVVNECGDISPKTVFDISVQNIPKKPFLIGPSGFCKGQSCIFYAEATDDDVSYHWENSCGWTGESTDDGTIMTYMPDGDKSMCTVSLTAKNVCGIGLPAEKIVPMKPCDPLDAFLLYPNPNNGDFSVSFFSNQAVEVDFIVYDAVGKKLVSEVFSARVGENQFSCLYPFLSTGIYRVELRYLDEVWIGKVMMTK